MNRKWILMVGFVALIFFCAIAYRNSGYGKISKPAYQLASALYSICLSKSNERLATIENQLAQADSQALVIDEEPLEVHESKWLQKIIDQAKSGNWESAASRARRMMEDQVDY